MYIYIYIYIYVYYKYIPYTNVLSTMYICINSDRFVNRAEQVSKHAEQVATNRPEIDELAGTRMFKEVSDDEEE